jgi:cholesterol transport system auxiliary component
MNAFWRMVLGGLGFALVLGGCALTSKGDAMSPRFFSPEPERSAKALPEPAGPPLELRLGQVEAASYLEERISYRLRPSELAYYEDRRWTEAPEHYLRRALAQELFERRHLRRIVSGRAATLDVELTAFEELRGPPAKVRLALSYTVHADGQSSLERSLVVERPLAQTNELDPPRQVAAALALALSDAVSQVSEEVTHTLRAPTPEPCAPATSVSNATPEPPPPGRTIPPE